MRLINKILFTALFAPPLLMSASMMVLGSTLSEVQMTGLGFWAITIILCLLFVNAPPLP